MYTNQRKEQFSIAYVRAIAAFARYSFYKPEIDDDSVDLGIVGRDGTGPLSSPRLELQLKCTSRDILGSNSLRFPITIKNYKDLIKNAFVPRILIVVVVPDDLSQWIEQSEEELCLRYCAYWTSLRGMLETKNTSNVTIEISRSNLFTVEVLQDIIERISFGGLP